MRLQRFTECCFVAAILVSFPLSGLAAPIRIGAIASLSGSAAEQGKNWLEGAELAADDLKQEGLEVKILTEDDTTLPANVHRSFEKLAGIEHVDAIIGGTWDFLAEAAAPQALRYALPFVTPTNPVEILSPTTKQNVWFFTNGLSLGATETAVQPVLRALHPRRVALIVPAVPFGISHADMLEKLLKEEGAEVLLRTEFSYEGYREVLRTVASRVAELKPDMVFVLTDYPALAAFAKDLKDRKVDSWILTTQHLDEAARLSPDPALWRKAIGIYPLLKDAAFEQRFKAKHGHAPKVYAAEGYDALLFLARAKRAGIDLSTQNFETQGVTGALQSVRSSRQISGLAAAPFQVGDGATLVPFAAEH